MTANNRSVTPARLYCASELHRDATKFATRFDNSRFADGDCCKHWTRGDARAVKFWVKIAVWATVVCWHVSISAKITDQVLSLPLLARSSLKRAAYRCRRVANTNILRSKKLIALCVSRDRASCFLNSCRFELITLEIRDMAFAANTLSSGSNSALLQFPISLQFPRYLHVSDPLHTWPYYVRNIL